ncbi:hypothetical protein PG994_006599 [Apiospora phragmitis]|uniref:Uncharacterized protein n=1 Tax=Apiospora phragmitis TaxID=2905665 RepID=A0ABR1VFL3_9PEZI
MPGQEDRYHWAIIVGPKTEDSDSRGHRFHAKEKINLVGNPPKPQSVWQYEAKDTGMLSTNILLVRIVVGKVKNMTRLRSILDNTPIRPEVKGGSYDPSTAATWDMLAKVELIS